MLKSALIAIGSGYADDRSFDPFEVVAFPLPTRESRVLKGANDRNAVCYGSHEIKLAVRRRDPEQTWMNDRRESTFYILVHHGGGTRVVQIEGVYGDDGATLEALKAMPEVALYGLLHGLYSAVANSIQIAKQETAQVWSEAAVDKRIKVGRLKQGRRRVEILPKADPLAP